MPKTVRLHRAFRASPEKVYRAFLDARGYPRFRVGVSADKGL
jgi:uncharacterized protein YndB with AHSA1/START domain